MVSTLYCSSTQLYLMDCLEKKKWIEMGLGKGSIPELGRSLGEGMATHSSVLAWRIPWTEEPGGLKSTGSQESNVTEGTEHSTQHMH